MSHLLGLEIEAAVACHDLDSEPDCQGETTGCVRGDQRFAVELTEKVRSIRLTFPCLSLMETVNFPLGSAVSGLDRRSSQRQSDSALNRPARFSPAGVPSIGKSAVTVKLSMSRPLS